MADAFIQLIVEKLISTVRSEVDLIQGVDKQLQTIAATFSTIAAVLLDADRRQIEDAAVALWFRRLKHAAYGVDDILDELSFHSSKNDPSPENKIDKLRSSFLLPTFTPFAAALRRRSIAKRIKTSVETLEILAQERVKFDLRLSPMADSPPPRRRSSSFAAAEVYGRDRDIETVVETLLRRRSAAAVEVYAVVGLGGLGKTTLVQKVYADERVKEHFGRLVWVCVSENGGAGGMAAAVLRAAATETAEVGLEQVQRRINEELQGRRYLLVLDDVWEEDEDGWEELRAALPAGDGGAAVVVTTRFAKTAALMATAAVHKLGCLSDEDCWEIFWRRAFAGRAESGGGIIAAGREIAKKCGGVPMAAVALGSMMRYKEEESQWISVKNSEIWRIERSCSRKPIIIPALRLSYEQLQPIQKRCFSFCAIFPRGFRVSRTCLIRLWISNSLISSSEMEEEDAGEEIFNELYCNCFFSDEIRGSSGQILSVKMHDLMYDLAMAVAGEEVLEIGGGDVSGDISHFVKHVTVVSGDVEAHAASLTAATESVRSLLQVHRGRIVFSGKAFCRICCGSPAMSFLRVFDGGGMMAAALPPCVGGLKHLRYLDLSNGAMKKLPESVSGLFHLQFLILRNCSDLKNLPKEITRLVNLRCLDINGCSSITSLPPGISKLRSLNSLSVFFVGKEGRRLIELKELNLRGEIQIKNLENVENPADARFVALEKKNSLRSLEFQWGKAVNKDLAMKILENLKPCANLRNLRIHNYSGDDFPLWMKNFSLEMITDLDLSSCENCSKIPELGHLRSLKTLKIVRMKKIQWINEEIDFPSLEFLSISVLPNLIRLCKLKNTKNPPFPNLKKLSVADCPNLILSHLPALTDLKCYGCSELLLTFIPSVQSLTLENLVIAINATVTKLPRFIFSNLTLLRSLRIDNFSKLKTLSEEQLRPLKSLKSIQIRHCDSLEHILDAAETLANDTKPLQKSTITLENDIKPLKNVTGTLKNAAGAIENDIKPPKNVTGTLKNAAGAIENLAGTLENDTKHPKNVTGTLKNAAGAIENLTGTLENHIKPPENLTGTLENHIKPPENDIKPLENVAGTLEKVAGVVEEGVGEWGEMESIEVVGCERLVELPWRIGGMPHLKRVEIRDNNRMVFIPERLREAPWIKELILTNCRMVKEIPEWIEEMKSLITLKVIFCPMIKRLPGSIKMLKKLQHLYVWGCPELLNRCRDEDSHLISHVPYLHFYPK